MAASWVPSEADGQKLPGISLRKTSANRRYGHVLQIFRSCGEKRQAPLPAAMIACMTVVARLVPLPTSGRRAACRACGASQDSAGEVTRLFVDADTHKIDDIDNAISKLEKMGRIVRTTVFAPPGRETNEYWQQLFRRPGIDFRPVQRAASRTGEANDAAIADALGSCADRSIALLTSDFDFRNACQAVIEHGKQVLVLTPSNNRKLIKRYQDAGIPVQGCFPRDGRSPKAPKVRAILHQDGSGSVKLDGPFYPYDNSELLKDTESFLRNLGYVARDREHLVHSTAKFWLANELGPVTVFPQQVAIEEFGQRVLGQGKKWRRYTADRAFLLPKVPTKRNWDDAKFGTQLAMRLFLGGGPFMLKDSEGMVPHALTQLGYLDDEMNADVLEAMLVFVNIADNRNALRKQVGVLPTLGDSPAEVEEKLRHAFLSHLTDGQWRTAPKDGDVRKLLRDKGFLDSANTTRQDVFQAMAEFARQHRLPKMKTYGGYAFRIRSATSSNSNRVATIELAAEPEAKRHVSRTLSKLRKQVAF